MTTKPKIRVLVVEDSAVMRASLRAMIGEQEDLEIVGEAPDPFVAREQVFDLRPDVMTLDIEMPRMDGLSFLERLMRHHPLPVVVVSTLTQERSRAAIRALALGAVDAIPKPKSQAGLPAMARRLVQAIRTAAGSRVQRVREASREPTPCSDPAGAVEVIALGASTGGIQALHAVVDSMPPSAPPILIVQHLPPEFTDSFVERLAERGRLRVRAARDGRLLARGEVVVAGGDRHLLVERTGAGLVARTPSGPRVHFQRPSVDVLFHSVAEHVGSAAVAAILTGMGRDGASGLLAIRQAGGYAVAQDEATSMVFGMPREAIAIGAVHRVVPLGDMTPVLLERCAVGVGKISCG